MNSVAQWNFRPIRPGNAAQMLSILLPSSSFKHLSSSMFVFHFSSSSQRKTRTSVGSMLTDEVSAVGDSFHFAINKDGFQLESVNKLFFMFQIHQNKEHESFDFKGSSFQIFWNMNMRTSVRIRRANRTLGLCPDVTEHESLTSSISINC